MSDETRTIEERLEEIEQRQAAATQAVETLGFYANAEVLGLRGDVRQAESAYEAEQAKVSELREQVRSLIEDGRDEVDRKCFAAREEAREAREANAGLREESDGYFESLREKVDELAGEKKARGHIEQRCADMQQERDRARLETIHAEARLAEVEQEQDEAREALEEVADTVAPDLELTEYKAIIEHTREVVTARDALTERVRVLEEYLRKCQDAGGLLNEAPALTPIPPQGGPRDE